MSKKYHKNDRTYILEDINITRVTSKDISTDDKVTATAENLSKY
jgi:hypothetical protein